MQTREELEQIDLETAKNDISNAVYAATGLFESLETVDKINGNGHHVRQKIALFAADLMEKRWRGHK